MRASRWDAIGIRVTVAALGNFAGAERNDPGQKKSKRVHGGGGENAVARRRQRADARNV